MKEENYTPKQGDCRVDATGTVSYYYTAGWRETWNDTPERTRAQLESQRRAIVHSAGGYTYWRKAVQEGEANE